MAVETRAGMISRGKKTKLALTRITLYPQETPKKILPLEVKRLI